MDISPVPRDVTRPIRVGVLGIFGLVVALFVWGFATGIFTSVENMRDWVASFGILGPLVYIAAQSAQVVVPVIPGGVGIVAGPVLFGFWQGSLWNYVAVVIGSLIDFQIGRHVGLPAVRAVFPAGAVDKYLLWTRHPRFARWFAVAIFLPIAPDDLLCYLAGTTGMRFRWFTWIILAGKPWAILIYSWLVLTVGGSLFDLLGWG